MVREKDAAFTLALIQAVVMLDYGCVGAMRTVLPYYAKSLGAAATGVGALETIYGLGQVIGALLLGKLSDRRGRKVVLLLSFAGSAVGYGMAAFAVSTGSASLLLLPPPPARPPHPCAPRRQRSPSRRRCRPWLCRRWVSLLSR